MKRLSFLLAATVAACSSSNPPCDVDGDCAVGEACSAEHTCGTKDGGALEPAPDTLAACTPNHDGTITRAEIAIVVPTSVTYRTSTETMVDLAGTADPTDATARVWDLSGALTGDHDMDVETLPVAGTWYASKFPDGLFASPLTVSGIVLTAIYANGDADSVVIQGAVSDADGLTRSELTYSPPLPAFTFPMSVGNSTTGTSTLSGLLSGVPTLVSVSWTQTVDASGTMVTPYGTFPVLRTRLDLVQNEGPVVITTHTYAFVAECYGAVAKVQSKPYELTEEFTTASEVSRLAP
ncbi:MAG TPA: hypothetical protein VGM90_10195 [Kofleriaceae bacterium]|jgi:hypothetical protein